MMNNITIERTKTAEEIQKIQAEDREVFELAERLMREQEIFLDSHLTLHSMAVMIGFTPNRLSRAVNNLSGHNFTGYVNGYRIRKAIEMIPKKPYKMIPINDLYKKVGFASYAPFFRAFTHITKVAPSKYREKLIQNRK